MKHIFIWLTLSCALLLQACSDENSPADTIAKNGSSDQIEKLFDLNSEQSEQFRTAYASYQAEVDKVLNEHAALAEKFNAKRAQGAVSEQSAINMMAEYFRIEAKRLQIQQNYMSIFQKTLSTEDVFRLYQQEKQQ